MAQVVRFIDISQSYIPVDPEAFPINLFDESRIEQASNPKAIVAYDGFNFLPTPHGYKSYFGTEFQLEIEALPSPVDKVLLFQGIDYTTVTIALCEDGLYMSISSTGTAWTKAIDSVRPSDGYYPWYWVLMGNDLWCWRRGDPNAYVMRYDPISDYEYTHPDLTDFALAFNATEDWVGTEDRAAIRYGIGFEKTNGFGTLQEEIFLTTGELGPLTGKAIDFTWTLPAGAEYTGKARLFKQSGTLENPEYSYMEFSEPTDLMLNTYLYTDLDGSGFTAIEDYPSQAWPTPTTLQRYAPIEKVLTFLNMASQEGMFAAGMRLGFWDTADSIATSAMDSFEDFVPSLSTLAGITKYADVRGTIVTILPLLTGFVIYSTGSIVHVRKDANSMTLWVPEKLSDFGISYARQVVRGPSVNVHYAITKVGIYAVGANSFEQILPEFWDTIKDRSQPTYIDLMQDRFLAFMSLDEQQDYRSVRTYADTQDWVCPVIKARDYYYMGGGSEIDSPFGEIELITGYWRLLPCIIAAQIKEVNLYSSIQNRYSAAIWEARYSRAMAFTPEEESTRLWQWQPGYDATLYQAADGEYLSQELWDLDVDQKHPLPAWNSNGPSYEEDAPFKFILEQIAVWAAVDADSKAFVESFIDGREIYSCLTPNDRPLNNQVLPTNTRIPWAWGPPMLRVQFMTFLITRKPTHVRPYSLVVTEEIEGDDIRSRYTLRLDPVQPVNSDEASVYGEVGGLLCIGWYHKETWEEELREEPWNDYQESFHTSGIPGTQRWIGGRYGDFHHSSFQGFDLRYGNEGYEEIKFIEWTSNAKPIYEPPESEFVVVQDGAPEPAYPLYRGAHIYDMNLKKWGKHSDVHFGYVNLHAVNQPFDSTIPYTAFLGKAGLISTDRKLRVFNDQPAESEICYGKLGYTRQGFTTVTEVIAHFRTPCSGSIEVECSMDGRHPEDFLGVSETFTDATQVKLFANFSARWYNVVIKGQYDLTYLEFRGLRAGRR